jgi:hypothetical protein
MLKSLFYQSHPHPAGTHTPSFDGRFLARISRRNLSAWGTLVAHSLSSRSESRF